MEKIFEHWFEVVLIMVVLINVCLTNYLYHKGRSETCGDLAKIWEHLEK